MTKKSGQGFAEQPAAYEPWPSERGPDIHRMTVGPGGRVVIPAEVRRRLRIEDGTPLIATVEDGELRIVTAASALKKLQEAFVATKQPGESVVDAFLSERRAMWGEE